MQYEYHEARLPNDSYVLSSFAPACAALLEFNFCFSQRKDEDLGVSTRLTYPPGTNRCDSCQA